MPHFNIGVWYNNVKKHGFYFLVSNKNLHIYIYSTLVCGPIEHYGINVQL